MKKLILLTLIILGTVSFARGGSSNNSDNNFFSGRDFEYNEKRDIVEPMEQNIDRLSRLSPYEFELDKIAAEENMKKYEDFHNELDRMDMGEESQR